MDVGVPVFWKFPASQRLDGDIVGNLDLHDYVVRRQFSGACKDFEGAERRVLSSVDNRHASAVPAAGVQTGSGSIISRVPAAPNPVDDHLPDAVLNAAENVFHLLDTALALQHFLRGGVAEGRDGGSEPTEGFGAIAKNLQGTGYNVHDFTNTNRANHLNTGPTRN